MVICLMEIEISILISILYVQFNTLQKAVLVASVHHIERFSNSGISIHNSEDPDTYNIKTRRRRRRKTQSIAKRYMFRVNAIKVSFDIFFLQFRNLNALLHFNCYCRPWTIFSSIVRHCIHRTRWSRSLILFSMGPFWGCSEILGDKNVTPP